MASTSSTMDPKQLFDVAKQIQKATDSGDSSAALLTILAPLEKFKATEDLLRQSKIGVAVTKLRGNKDPKVSEAAARLVSRWKQEVNMQNSHKRKKVSGGSSPKAGSASATKAAPASASARNSATSSPAPPAQPAKVEEDKKSSVDPEKRNTVTDKVDHKLTGDPVRDGCLKLMYDGIAFASQWPSDEILKVACKVERAAFEHFTQKTSPEYKAKIRSLYQNLKMKTNAPLRRNVFSEKIKATKFVTMSSDELKSAERQAEDALLEKENMNKSMTPQEIKAISTTFTCGKCKQNKVAYSQAQTRSADEPLTTFCECVNCGNRWKFS